MREALASAGAGLRAFWPLVFAALALAAVWAVIQPLPFPPGGDPGHMVGLGRRGAFGSPYAPLLPAVLGAMWWIVGQWPPVFFVLVKLLAIACLVFVGCATAKVIRALGGSMRAQELGLLLAVVNPMALYEVLWGGLAQFVGIAASMFGLAALLEANGDGRSRFIAAAWAAVAVLAHWYSAVFLLAAASAAWLTTGAWRMGLRRWLAPAALGLAVALPSFWSYVAVARDLRPEVGPRAIVTISYFRGFAGLAEQRSFMFGSSLALLAVSGLSLAKFGFPCGTNRRRVGAFAVGVASGFLVLLAATPADLAGRAYYFLPILLVPLCALAIAGCAPRAAPSPPRHSVERFRRVVTVLGLAAMSCMAVAGIAAMGEDAPFFAPMPSASFQAFEALRDRTEGGTVVYSPFANIDGWWLGAVTGRPTAPTDQARYYSLSSEMALLHMASAAAAGESYLDLGEAAFATSPVRGAPAYATVLAKRDGNLLAVAQLDEAAAWVEFANGSVPLRGPVAPAFARDSASSAPPQSSDVQGWATARGQVGRALRIDGTAIELHYALPEGATALVLPVRPGARSAFAAASAGMTHHWAPGDIPTTIATRPIPVEVTPLQAVFRLEANGTNAVLRLDWGAQGLRADAWEDTNAALRAAGMDGVYLREAAEPTLRRFLLDPAYDVLWSDGAIWAVRLTPAGGP